MSSSRSADLPSRMRGLRACLRCHLIKTAEQFRDDGCDNCIVEDEQDDYNVSFNTTPTFKGLLALTQPQQSWVARWHKLNRKHKGLYAMKVYGENNNNNNNNNNASQDE